MAAFLTILHVIAITLTGWRYYCRLTTARLWLDDHCALVALCLDLAFLITLWIEMKFPIHSYRNNLIILWAKVVFFTGCVWASRMSIAMSIARVAPTSGSFGIRRHAYAILIFFTSMAVGLVIWIGAECTSSTTWFKQQMHQCQVSNALGTCILASHVLVDVFLVATPLIFFWRHPSFPLSSLLCIWHFNFQVSLPVDTVGNWFCFLDISKQR
ncbi:hypothetical protein BDN72DRAFT_457756 [Pluteus cervinus]|uniref:Uncharacterized protein n=1 Tax=Pluteus cervinus TaxID=181527 RepID=A0ACD3B2G4_9AGAR|nr:hypothetical protein BDN72DRAFT_457756 [Pluteus cervinus]